MPTRRHVLQSVPAGLAAVAGCLSVGGAPSDGGDSEPGDTTPVTQFQYGPEHAGEATSDAPAEIEVAWRKRLPGTGGGVGLSVADGRIVAGANFTIAALDTAEGEEEWSTTVDHDPFYDPGGAPALTGDTAYITASGGSGSIDGGVPAVVAVDLATGDEHWRALPDLVVRAPPTLADGRVYVGDIRGEHVIALDAEDGEELWRYPVGEYASPPSVVGGTAYVGGGTESRVAAVDAAGGDERWSVGVDGEVSGAPTVVEDTVYVGTRAGTVYALDAADGDERWSVTVGDFLRESLAVGNGYVIAPDSGPVHALSTDGERQWSVEPPSEIDRSVYAPTIAGDAVVATDHEVAFCLDLATGDRRWRHVPRERHENDFSLLGYRCAPVVHDGVVYTVSSAGDVYALAAPA